MKITVIGGGSTYTPELLHGLAMRSHELGLREVVLYDIDTERLATIGAFVSRMCAPIAPRLSVVCESDRRRSLDGARFVIAQIRVGGQRARLEDEHLGRDHGIIGQETTGVGGLACALRTVPAMLAIAREIESAAPEATLINFTNPVSIVTEALLAKTPLRVIGLCNIPIAQRLEIAKHLDVDPEIVEIDSVGLNHLSFVRAVRVAGRDMLPSLLRDVSTTLARGHRVANMPDLDFPAELLENLRMIPSDYLRYFFLATEAVAEQRAASRLRAEEVMEIEEELLAHYARPGVLERSAASVRRGGAHYSHAAIELIDAIVRDRGRSLVVDVRNGGTLRELPPGACVEVPCRVDRRGAEPLVQAPLEPAIRGLIQCIKAYEELAVAAAASRARSDVYLAVLSHPHVQSAALAAMITDRLMSSHRAG